MLRHGTSHRPSCRRARTPETRTRPPTTRPARRPTRFAKTTLNAVIHEPSGIAVGPDGLVYVGTPDATYRFAPYAATLKTDPSRTLAKTGPLAGPDAYKQPPIKLVVKNLPGDITPSGASGARHSLKRFVFDKRDPWTMYVNVGSASDTCEQGPGAKPPSGYPFPCPEAESGSPRGGIRKYVLAGPDHLGGSFTTIAKGLRNSMALAVHPTSDLLIQGENSRDLINKLDASPTDQEGDLRAYVTAGDANSELVLRLKGQGFPQMPAGGVSPEQLQEVQSWIHDGALLPH